MLPLSVTSVAFLAANCGALEIVGIVAASAKYGLPALHFYWIGAIPAMVFLALFMLPVYRHSRALTVPDFLRIRYNDATHVLSSSCLAAMMALIAVSGFTQSRQCCICSSAGVSSGSHFSHLPSSCATSCPVALEPPSTTKFFSSS
jgi:Na+/proline symporter